MIALIDFIIYNEHMIEIIVFIAGFIYLARRIERLERAQKYSDALKVSPQKVSYFEQLTGEQEAPMTSTIPTLPQQESPATQPLERYEDAQGKIVVPEASLSSEQSDREFEFKIGSKIFAGVGMLAVLLGVGFFLRYAFENNLITESARIFLGMTGGVILIGVGWFLRRQYVAYSAVLTGGGIGLFYISLYASYNFYSLTSQPVAFLSMALVTGLAVALAVFYDSASLAGFALLGGFLTPFLLPSPASTPHQLFLYVLLLNGGVLCAAWYRSWSQLTLGAFLGTALIVFMWQGSDYVDSQFFISLGYSTVFFFLFVVITLMHQLLKQEAPKEAVGALMFLTPAAYFVQNYFLIDHLYPDKRIFFVLGLAVFYATLGLLLKTKPVYPKDQTSQFYFATAITFFAISVPIYFHQHWITIGWAVQGLVVLLVGLAFRMAIMRRFGFAILLLSCIRLFAFDSELARGAVALWNSRNLTFLMVALSAYAGAIASMASSVVGGREGWDEDEKGEVSNIEILLYVMGYALCVWGVTLEVDAFYSGSWLAIWWALLASAGVAQSFLTSRKFVRWCAYVVMVGALTHIVFYDLSVDMASYVPLFNMRFLVLLMGAASSTAIALLLKHYSSVVEEDERGLMKPTVFIVFHGLLLTLVSLEVLDAFNVQIFVAQSDTAALSVLYNMQRAMLSVAWIFYAVALLLIGIWQKSLYARRGAIILFGATVFKIFLYDTINLTDFYRFISFISLGVVLLFAGFLYYRFQDRILHFIDAKADHS